MNDLGKLMMIAGVVLVVVGALMWSGIGRGWVGRLPGDIHYTKGNYSLHFPIVTCVVMSIILTVLLRIFRR
jgi:hypothetical protein